MLSPMRRRTAHRAPVSTSSRSLLETYRAPARRRVMTFRGLHARTNMYTPIETSIRSIPSYNSRMNDPLTGSTRLYPACWCVHSHVMMGFALGIYLAASLISPNGSGRHWSGPGGCRVCTLLVTISPIVSARPTRLSSPRTQRLRCVLLPFDNANRSRLCPFLAGQR